MTLNAGPRGPSARPRARRLLPVLRGLGVLAAMGAPLAAWAGPEVVPTGLLDLDHRSRLTFYDGDTTSQSAQFALARFRGGVRATEGRWTVQLTAEAVGRTLAPLDAFADFAIADGLALQVGQARGPLGGLFHRESITTQAFSERAGIELAFRQRRDLGVGLDWQPAELPLAVNARLGNGSGPEGVLPALYLSVEGRFGRAHRKHTAQPHGLWVGVSGLLESVAERSSVGFNGPFGQTLIQGQLVRGDRSVADAFAVAFLGPVRLRVEVAAAVEQARAPGDHAGFVGALSVAGVGQLRRGQVAAQTTTPDEYRSYGLAAEVNWVARGEARAVGQAPQAPTEGPALEISLRYDGLRAPRTDDAFLNQHMNLFAVGAKAWMNDWWSLALVGFGASGHTATLDGTRSYFLTQEGGVFLRNSFYFAGR